jgi:hypothetical protein
MSRATAIDSQQKYTNINNVLQQDTKRRADQNNGRADQNNAHRTALPQSKMTHVYTNDKKIENVMYDTQTKNVLLLLYKIVD